MLINEHKIDGLHTVLVGLLEDCHTGSHHIIITYPLTQHGCRSPTETPSWAFWYDPAVGEQKRTPGFSKPFPVKQPLTPMNILTAVLIQYAIAIVCPLPTRNCRFRCIILWGLMSLPFAQQAK